MFIDFHSHFLPGIDDGAQDIQMGCEMAAQAYRQGVEYLVATPHFYPADSMSVKEAKIQRDESYNNLSKKFTTESERSKLLNNPEIFPFICAPIVFVDFSFDFMS